IGIALDSAYSFLQGRISEAELNRIIRLMQTLGFDLYASELRGDNLVKGLKEYQEHLGGQLTIMLLEIRGYGIEVHEMDEDLIHQSVYLLRSFQEKSDLITS